MATYGITYIERIIRTIDLDAESHQEAEAIFDDDIALDGNEEIDLVIRRVRSDSALTGEVTQ